LLFAKPYSMETNLSHGFSWNFSVDYSLKCCNEGRFSNITRKYSAIVTYGDRDPEGEHILPEQKALLSKNLLKI